MNKDKKQKFDAGRRRSTGNSRCFKKRKFNGNRHTALSKTESLPKKRHVSTSAKKLITPKKDISENSSTFSNIIIDLDILSDIISLIGTCPECESKNLCFDIDHSKKKGLSCCLKFKCKNCHIWSKEMYTSKKVENEGKGKAPFDINIRSVIAMRVIGRGYSSLEKFCGFLNLLSPMQVGAFNETQKNIAKAYNVVATESMIAAADQLKENVDDQGITDITVSCDGT